MKIEINRINDAYHMEAKGVGTTTVHMDANPEIGGIDAGARPMELVLMGLGSCSAVDVISILKKQRQDLKDLKIIVDAERDKNTTPAVFTKIHVNFIFEGDLDDKKVKRAIELSMEKYCSVSAMLSKTAVITNSFEIRN